MEEKVRVWYSILGMKTYCQEVKTPEEAKLVINSIADFLNFMVEEDVIAGHCSSAGIEVYDEEDGWVEWYSDDGKDINEYEAEK